jgi:uncharacterized protein
MARFLVGFAFAVVAAHAGAQEQSVTIVGPDGNVLAGTMTWPAERDAPCPVALTLTGSGLHYRDGNRAPDHPYRPFRDIAAALTARGIATLRLDDRGIGGSTGNGAAATGDDTAADARAAIAWLRRQAGIDPARIALIGHSFGGVIAPIVAEGDERIAAIVLMGAPARSFRETMRYQLRYEISRDRAIAVERRAATLDEAMARQDRNVKASDEQWRRWLQDRDPLPVAARVRAPALILQGGTDRAVAPDSASMLAEAMRAGGNARVTVRMLEGVNHHFQRDAVGARDGYDRLPVQALAPEALDAMGQWLEATLCVTRSSRASPAARTSCRRP